MTTPSSMHRRRRWGKMPWDGRNEQLAPPGFIVVFVARVWYCCSFWWWSIHMECFPTSFGFGTHVFLSLLSWWAKHSMLAKYPILIIPIVCCELTPTALRTVWTGSTCAASRLPAARGLSATRWLQMLVCKTLLMHLGNNLMPWLWCSCTDKTLRGYPPPAGYPPPGYAPPPAGYLMPPWEEFSSSQVPKLKDWRLARFMNLSKTAHFLQLDFLNILWSC